MQDAGDYKIGSTSAPVAAKKAPVASGPSFGVPAKVEPFTLLAKSQKGAAAAGLVMKALAAEGVYVFGELLEMPTVKDLAAHAEFASAHALLEVFAYGTWSDYKAQRTLANLPELNAAQTTKLKQLTVLSLAANQRVLPYARLLEALELESVPALEDLLIDAIYKGLLGGRLDQRESRFELTNSLGRDVRPVPTPLTAPVAAAEGEVGMEVDAAVEGDPIAASGAQDVASLGGALQGWLGTISSLLASLAGHLAQIQANAVNEAHVLAEQETAVKLVLESVTAEKGKGKGKSKNADKDDAFEPFRGEGKAVSGGGRGTRAGAKPASGGALDEKVEEMDLDEEAARKRGAVGKRRRVSGAGN